MSVWLGWGSAGVVFVVCHGLFFAAVYRNSARLVTWGCLATLALFLGVLISVSVATGSGSLGVGAALAAGLAGPPLWWGHLLRQRMLTGTSTKPIAPFRQGRSD